MSAGSSDSKRIREMGWILSTVWVLIAVYTLLSVFTLSIIGRMTFSPNIGIGLPQSKLVLAFVLDALKFAFLLISLVAMFTSNRPRAIYFTIFAIWFAMFGEYLLVVLTNAYFYSEALNFGRLHFSGILGLFVAGAASLYFISSNRVASIYGLGTRQKVMSGLFDIWQRGRGKPTAREAELSILDETFR